MKGTFKEAQKRLKQKLLWYIIASAMAVISILTATLFLE